jgi:hypothetical protein
MVARVDTKPGEQGRANNIRSIIVVEDEEDVAYLIRDSLEHEGFRVRAATTGKVALDLLRSPQILSSRTSRIITRPNSLRVKIAARALHICHALIGSHVRGSSSFKELTELKRHDNVAFTWLSDNGTSI